MQALSYFIIALFAFVAVAVAQTPPAPGKTLTEIYNSGQLQEKLFSDRFLQQVPIEQLTTILQDMRRKFGHALRSEGKAGSYQIITEQYRIPATLILNQEHQISGLLLKPAIPKLKAPEAFLARLKELPGKTALLLTKNGTPVIQHNAKQPLAVGSAFKLAVLVALQNKIRAGKARWSDVIILKEHHLSLPSGILQDMPPGAPLTLHTLASLMIAQSDNTATDALMHHLKRSTVEAVSGLRPMLTTREMFQLKADNASYDVYANADLNGQRALLERLANRPPPQIAKLHNKLRPREEWYIPLTSICGWLKDVRKLDLMRINPGLATQKHWRSIAYKGGSNSGVLNFSTWLVDAEGNSYCLAITWNTQQTIDQAKLSGIYTGLIELLRQPGK